MFVAPNMVKYWKCEPFQLQQMFRYYILDGLSIIMTKLDRNSMYVVFDIIYGDKSIQQMPHTFWAETER